MHTTPDLNSLLEELLLLLLLLLVICNLKIWLLEEVSSLLFELNILWCQNINRLERYVRYVCVRINLFKIKND